MDILGKQVQNVEYGVGTVISQDAKYIQVEFKDCKKKFKYPDAFGKFLTTVDADTQSALLQEATGVLNAAAKAKSDAIAKAEASRKAAAEEAKTTKEVSRKGSGTKAQEKVVASFPRVEGKPKTFYVFQGNTFVQESMGGYIWAPIVGRDGKGKHHWDSLLEVREGDIILHGNDAIPVIKVLHGLFIGPGIQIIICFMVPQLFAKILE